MLGIRFDVMLLGFQMLMLFPLVCRCGLDGYRRAQEGSYFLFGFHLNFESIFMSFISFL